MSQYEAMSSDLSISVEAAPSKELTRTLFDGLSQANVERTRDGKTERLCVVARDAKGTLVGGVFGEVYWGWLNVVVLWVAPTLRRQGLGTRLLSRAELEATAKGCHGVYLDTFTFQGYDLYLRAGYEIFGTLEQFPSGHSRHFLRKRLHAA
jgi:GNAT superfamily N-acetyltransferase